MENLTSHGKHRSGLSGASHPTFHNRFPGRRLVGGRPVELASHSTSPGDLRRNHLRLVRPEAPAGQSGTRARADQPRALIAPRDRTRTNVATSRRELPFPWAPVLRPVNAREPSFVVQYAARGWSVHYFPIDPVPSAPTPRCACHVVVCAVLMDCRRTGGCLLCGSHRLGPVHHARLRRPPPRSTGRWCSLRTFPSGCSCPSCGAESRSGSPPMRTMLAPVLEDLRLSPVLDTRRLSAGG